MPKVGPIDGWRMVTVAGRPMRERAWPRPIVVVVLPSPSGVGVTDETTMYLAFGRPASSSIAASLILATSWPYGSSRCGPMPMRAAMSAMGRSRARRAISRSVEKVIAINLLLGLESRHRFLAPPLRWLDLVECEQVNPGHLALWRREVRHQARRKPLWDVATGLDHAQEPVGMAAQESR